MLKKQISYFIGLLMIVTITACSSSSVPDDVFRNAALHETSHPAEYDIINLNKTNEYEKNFDGEVWTIIEYEMTYAMNASAKEKMKSSTYPAWMKENAVIPKNKSGRFFFIKRGGEWYSDHKSFSD